MTKTDWTAAEVRTIVKNIKGHVMTVGERADMFDIADAFATRIAADESVAPVVWVDPDDVAEKRKAVMGTADPYEHKGTRYKLPLFIHPPAQPAQETPCSLHEALNVIEHWGRRGNTLNGDDVDRFRALADKIAPAQEQPGGRVTGNALAWMTPGGDVSRSYLWCAERCRDEQRPIPLYLAASPTPPAQAEQVDRRVAIRLAQHGAEYAYRHYSWSIEPLQDGCEEHIDSWIAQASDATTAEPAQEQPGGRVPEVLTKLYTAASKGFHMSAICGPDSLYMHKLKFPTMQDLFDFEKVWREVLLAASPTPPKEK